LCLLKEISGFPKTELSFFLYLKPLENNAFERLISIFEPFDFTACIFFFLCSAVSLSIIYFSIILNSDFSKSSKPIAFVINGGPGYESSHYRTYGFRDGVEEQPGERDSLSSLLKNFRVVLVDQRGTQGLSERLKMDQVRGDYHLVAKFFGSDVVARDMAKVIKGIIKPGEDYIIVGQSYGGRILSQLITGPWMATLPQPKGIVFSSSMMPHYPVGDDSMKERAIKQRELNLQLLKAVPDIKNKIGALKNHFKKLGLDPELVHHLFSMLGKGLDGEWEGALAKKVEELIEQSKEQVLGFLEKEMNHPRFKGNNF
jgi:hypothetical protein